MQVRYIATCPYMFANGKKNVDGLAAIEAINKAICDQGLSLDKQAVERVLNEYGAVATDLAIAIKPHLIAEEADETRMLTHPITGFTQSAADWVADANDWEDDSQSVLEQFNSLLPTEQPVQSNDSDAINVNELMGSMVSELNEWRATAMRHNGALISFRWIVIDNASRALSIKPTTDASHAESQWELKLAPSDLQDVTHFTMTGALHAAREMEKLAPDAAPFQVYDFQDFANEKVNELLNTIEFIKSRSTEPFVVPLAQEKTDSDDLTM